ncbi:MAG: hypothetical protein QNK23_02785 [Crocinitomicaceae bacterium]|nr:hypothetical protein [Crocinitomicaceae bacterium]
MSVERKCLNCGTWNKDNEYCTNCKEAVSPVVIEEIREQKREERRNSIPPSKIDVFLDKWKNSRFFLLKVLYHILYSIAVIFFSIAGFFAWLAASPNG